MARILCVEDDPQVGELVKRFLEREGFSVAWVRTGREALAQAWKAPKPDLVVLDRGLPDLEGLEVLKSLRELDPLLPVLLLTGRADEESRVEGLLEGADDYLGKPFSLKELLARIKALLRRAGKEGRRRFGPLELDLEARKAYWEGEPLRLSATEMNLLLALAQAPGRVYTRGELLERVWGPEFEGSERVVDAYIRLLRKKLKDDPQAPRFIETVVGVGYRFLGE
ncbi:MAG: response regulator transcription factor [Thermus sp.]|uniref:response regulator transcription factor n=1 Tax=unclassified Thermus TaxID=2619321 RepID=UPI00059D50C8|nr:MULTISPECIES: response regulator transcription factor [unclassified Thermus]MCS6867944.1 response regulator transcription factor [Thermus sp.]MCS7218853.1 response regulator transcription factor [Thermus sp.]MCX7850669.1 response regulator transcription factor [Thermus sp.]MDW8017622.1 response regulator transcription factor [Thermus sp.]MDW8356649.1 response regulator transcription factor [Thermus sp.]